MEDEFVIILAHEKKLCYGNLSGPPSRLVSTAGNLCMRTQNRLLPENADRLVLIIKIKYLTEQQKVIVAYIFSLNLLLCKK